MGHNFDKALTHQYHKPQRMHAGQGLRQPLIVARQAAFDGQMSRVIGGFYE
jgi:hypothetical protein